MQHDNLHNKEIIYLALSECAAWLTTLNHLKDESYSLKTKLIEVLDNNTDKDLIAEAENFHNVIIIRDEYIRDITTDTKGQETKLKEAILKNLPDRLWVTPQQKLRNEIAYLEKDFLNIREYFYHKFLQRTAS